MATTDARAKVAKLLDALEEKEIERRSQIDDAILAIRDLVGGGEGLAMKLAFLRRFICDAWQGRYQTPLVYSDIENVPHLKRFMSSKGKLSKDEIAKRYRLFIESDDPYYVAQRHRFSLFVRDINAFVTALPLQHVNDRAASDTSEKLRGLRGE